MDELPRARSPPPVPVLVLVLNPRDALEGVPPPPFQGAQPMPSHSSPNASCQPQWHL